MRELLQSKIHRATVTEANLNYTGSITIDKELMEKVELWEGQKVLVTSLTSGARLETYVIPGKSGEICINGSAAHLIKKGEIVIIMGFELTNKPIKAKIILVDEKNKFIKEL